MTTAADDDGNSLYHLDIKLHMLVTKVQFDTAYPGGPRATGIEYLEGVLTASKEVIVAAGAFNTPQILMLSGIGPAGELSAHGIEQLADLPVGLQPPRPHRGARHQRGARPTSASSAAAPSCTATRTSRTRAWRGGSPGPGRRAKGAYATNGLAVGVAIQTSGAPLTGDPDIFVYGGHANFPGLFPGWSELALHSDHRHWVWDSLIPLDEPFEETKPGRGAVGGEDEDEDEDDVKQYVETSSFGHHACCTAAIGTVLDSRFRVRGVQGLRVVDAPAFPVISGFFN